MAMGAERAFGTPPDALISYEAFAPNEKHLLHWYDQRGVDVPYYVLDKGGVPPSGVRVGTYDAVNSTCPCAGLSTISHGYGDDNPNNVWLPLVAEYVMGTLRPDVYWGENAPGFAGKIGKNIRENMRRIGVDNGYTMTVYRTKTLLHGLPQVRERSFYFFWRGNRTPILDWYDRPYQKIEDLITGVTSNFQMEPINPKTPSRDDPIYRYLLEVIHPGMTHREFSQSQPIVTNLKQMDVLSYIQNQGHTEDDIARWMRAQGLDREADKAERRGAKLAAGLGIMKRNTCIPRDHIGAFVGHYPHMLAHPTEDRYITFREAMTIMGMPDDFELLDPEKSSNHICQNVPVQTAADMSSEVLAYLEGRRETTSAPYVYQFNASKTVRYEDEPATLEEFVS
jgi:site-specific DNA-cytosine methylase